MVKRVAALGYYGFGNLGDEAVLAGIRSALQQTIPPHSLLALTNDPAETVRLHPGVETVNRWRWREVNAALKNTDLFIFGGGSLLQDATSVSSVVWYTLMALLARRRARRLLWWGQGIGPLVSPLSRRLVRMIARQADAITVRDPQSDKLMKETGFGGSISLVADPAFALNPLPSPADASAPSSLLWALRFWRDDRVGKVLSQSKEQDWLREWSKQGNAATGMIGQPMHLPEDKEYMARVLPTGLTLRDWRAENETPANILAQTASARLVIAMRLHALIFAARVGTPFIAVSYDPKVDALARASGQEDTLIAVDNFSGDALREAVARVRDTEAERRNVLAAFAEKQREQALRPAHIAASLLA